LANPISADRYTIRESVEDYEYMVMLRDRVRVKVPEAVAALGAEP
jgi:hypothetical protein